MWSYFQNLVKGKDEILYLPANDNDFLAHSNPPNKFKPHSARNYWNKVNQILFKEPEVCVMVKE